MLSQIQYLREDSPRPNEVHSGHRQPYVDLQSNRRSNASQGRNRRLAVTMLVGVEHRPRHARATGELRLTHAALPTNLAKQLAGDPAAGVHRIGAHIANVSESANNATPPRAASTGVSDQPSATIRSIGTRALAAMSSGTRTSNFMSRSASRSLGSVIIFMYLHDASAFAGMKSTSGAAIRSG